MAYVRKTDILVDAIRTKVRTMSSTAQEQYGSSTLEIGSSEYNDMRKSVEAKTWASNPDMQGKLPDDWCGTPRRVDVLVCDTNADVVARCYVENTVANPIRLSPEFKGDAYPDVTVSTAELTGAAKSWVNELSSNTAKRTEIRDQFILVEVQLVNFMDQHASLNAALTEMPELEMYVPDKYVAKVRAKSEPRAKVERPTNVQDLNIDVDALAAAAITHRMVTASGAS